MYAILVVIGIGLAGAIALQVAIARNGPAVLDTIDRLAGDSADVERLPSIAFGDHPQQKLIVQRPEGTMADSRLPVLVFIHGGSWNSGDPDDYNFVGRSFAPTGLIVVKAGYRLGPKGAFPGMLEDGAAALAWVRDNIDALGGDPSRIMLMGHSAGAYNAAMLALDPQWLEAARVPASSIKGVIGLAGPYDFFPFDSDSTKAAFGAAPDPEATQPVNFARAEAPPFLLVHGAKDTTVRLRNSEALKKALEAEGNSVEIHVFEAMDHTAPLLHLASPWREGRLGGEGPELRDTILQFLGNLETSVPVQPETR